MSLFIDKLRANPNCQVRIVSNKGVTGSLDPSKPTGDSNTIAVVGFLQDDFQFSLSNSYRPLYEMTGLQDANKKIAQFEAAGDIASQSQLGAGVRAAGAAVSNFIGGNRILDFKMTRSEYDFPEKVVFTLPLTFIAIRKNDDPRDFIKELAKGSSAGVRYTSVNRVLPEELQGLGGDFEIGTMVPPHKRIGLISIEIGKWFRGLNKFVIRDVSFKISKEYTTKGVPLYVEANVSFESFLALTTEQIQSMFVGVPNVE